MCGFSSRDVKELLPFFMIRTEKIEEQDVRKKKGLITVLTSTMKTVIRIVAPI